MNRYFLVYKPFQVLSQFSASGDKKTLKDLFKVPSTLYPVGRLDYDSEGLLILTDDNFIKHRLTDPSFEHEKEYFVQVEGLVSQEAISQLQNGVTISIDGKAYHTKPAKAKIISEPLLPERNPPIRFRKNIPTSWISLAISEGKNRQVRRMTAATSYPTLRLVRFRIGRLTIEGMQPGDMAEISRNELYKSLGYSISS